MGSPDAQNAFLDATFGPKEEKKGSGGRGSGGRGDKSERDFYMNPEEAVKYGIIDKVAIKTPAEAAPAKEAKAAEAGDDKAAADAPAKATPAEPASA